MAREIDELVLKMDFDNAGFKQAAAETLTTLKNLENSLDGVKMKNVGKEANRAFKEINHAANTVDLGNIERQLQSTHRQFDLLGTVGRTAIFRLTNDVISASRKIGGKLTSSIREGLFEGGFARAQNIEQAEFMLKGLGANVEEISQAAMNAVKGTAFGFDEAARVASQFFATGIEDAQEMESALLGVSGVAAMTGRSYGDIGQIFTTVAGQGRLMAQQLNQFAASGLNVAADLADYFEVDEATLRDMVSKGQVAFDDFQKAMSEKYGEHALSAAETYSGAKSMPRSALARIGADFAAPYMEGMKHIYNALAPMVDAIHELLKPVISLFEKAFGGHAAKAVERIGAITKAVQALNSYLSGGEGAPQWIINLVDSFRHLRGEFAKLGDSFNRSKNWAFWDLFEGFDLTKITHGILQMVEAFSFSELFLYNHAKIWALIFEVMKFAGHIFAEVAKGIGSVARGIGQYIIPEITHLIRFVAEVIRLFSEWVRGSDLVGNAIQGVANIINFALKGVGLFLKGLNWVGDQIVYVMQAIRDGGVFDERSIFSGSEKVSNFIRDAVGHLKQFAEIIGSIKTHAVDNLVNGFKLLGTLVSEVWKTFRQFTQSLDFSWIGNLLNRLSGFKNPFDGLKLPEWDFRSVTASIQDIGGSFRSAMASGERLPWERITQPIVNGVKAVVEYVRNIKWGDLLGNIWDGLKSGGKAALDFGKSIHESISNAINNVDWVSLGSTVAEKVSQGLEKIKEIASKIGEWIKDGVSNIKPGEIWEGFTDGMDGVADKLHDFLLGVRSELDPNFDKAQIPDKITVEEKVVVESDLDVSGATKSVEGQVRSLADTITAIFKSLAESSVGQALSEAFKPIKDLGTGIGTLAGFITNPLQGVKDAVDNSFNDIGESIKTGGKTIFDALNDFFKSSTGAEWLSGIGTLLGGTGLLQMGHAFQKLSDSLGAIPQAIGETIESIGTSLQTMAKTAQLEARGNFLLKLAGSIGILALSLWALSRIEPERLAMAGLALGALMAGVYVMSKKLSELDGTVDKGIGLALLGIAAAVFSFYLVIQKLEGMDWQSFASNLGKLIALLGVLALVVGGLSLAGGGALKGVGKSLMGLALGIFAMYIAVKGFSNMEWEQITDGLLKVGVSLLMLVGALAFMSHLVKGLPKAAGALTLLGGGLIILYFAIQAYSDMDWDTLFVGLLKVGLVLGVLIGALVAMSKWVTDLPKAAGALMLLAGGLLILYIAVKGFGDMEWESLIRGLAGVGVGLFMLTKFMNAIKPPEIIKAAGALLILGGGLLVLYFAVQQFANMDLEAMIQGLVGVAASIGILIAALWGMNKFANPAALAKMAVGMIILAGGIFVLGHAFQAFENVSWDSIWQGLVGVAGALAILLLAALGAEFVALGLGVLVLALLGIAVAAVIFAGAVWIIAEAMDTASIAFERFVKSLEDTGPALESFGEGLAALKSTGGIDAIQDLMNIGVSPGSILNLHRIFNNLKSIGPEVGPSLEAFADGLAELGDNIHHIDALLGIDVERGSIKNLSRIFEVLGEVAPESGQALSDLSQGVTDLAGATEPLQKLANLDISKNDGLKNFFGSLNNIDPDTGTSLASLGDALSGFDESTVNTIKSLAAVGSDTQMAGLGGGGGIGNLFAAFNKIKPETGTNIESFAAAIGLLSDKTTVLRTLTSVGEGVGLGDASGLGNLFDAFNKIKPETAGNIESFAAAVGTLSDKAEALRTLTSVGDGVGLGDASGLGNLLDAFNRLNPDAGSNIESLAASIKVLADTLPTLEELNIDGLTEIGTKLGEALGTNLSDAISNAADAVGNAVSSLADAAGGKESDFKSKGDEAGKAFGDGVKSGIEGKKGDVKTAGGTLGQSAATGARSKRDGMVSAGKYLADGMAAGIRQGMSGVREAAASLAQAAVESAKANLKIQSPSRVFMEIGRFTSEGLAIGIDQNAPMAVDSVVDMLDEAIKMTGIKQLELSEAQKSFAKQLARDLTTDHVGKRLNRLATHSRAVYATMIRDRRIEQEEEAERLEDEKIKAYEDVENARDRLADMDEREREQARENKEDSRSAKRKELDENKARRDREKAERDYQRAVAAKNRYEYRMHGEEAGVAFINGVAFGMIQESDAVPTFHHVFSEVLYEELEMLEKKADEAFKAFKEPGNILDNVTSIADEFENMSRSIGRAGRAASDRGWARNMRDVYDSMVNILSTSLGIFDSLKVLEPYLPAMLQGADRELAKFMPMIEQNIPQLAPILGNGLINALGTIAGPVAGAVAIVAAIIIDGLTDGGIRKGLDNFKDRLLAWLTDLPSRIVGWMTKIVSNLPDIFLWLVEFVADVAIGLIHMITELIATSPKLLVDLVLAVAMALVKLIAQLPGLLVEVLFALGEALITGLIPGIFKAVINLIPQMLRLGWELITGLINGVVAGAQRLWDAIVNPIRNAINAIKRLFGIEVKDDFEDIGKQMGKGMSDGMADGGDRINRQFREMMERMQRDSSGIDTTIYVGLDTTELDKSLDRIRGNVPVTLNQGVYTPAFTAMRAAENAQTVQNVTNIEYNQTVQTPQEMRTIDVYRASRRGLTEVTGVAVYA